MGFTRIKERVKVKGIFPPANHSLSVRYPYKMKEKRTTFPQQTDFSMKLKEGPKSCSLFCFFSQALTLLHTKNLFYRKPIQIAISSIENLENIRIKVVCATSYEPHCLYVL